jgi:hypothetical protein
MDFFEAHDLAMHIHGKDRDLQFEAIIELAPGLNTYKLAMYNFRTGAIIEFTSRAHFENWYRGRRLVATLIQQYERGA